MLNGEAECQVEHGLACRAKVSPKKVKGVQQLVEVGVMAEHGFQRVPGAGLKKAGDG